MARLQWDKTGERLYETGVDRGVLFPYNSEKSNYDKGVQWNGLTAVNESPSGAEANPVYADNIKYLNLLSAEEFGYTIEAYTYPEEFAKCDGSYVKNGVFVGQQARIPFGFSYRTIIGNDTEGNDHGYLIHLVWNSLAAPSEKSRSTVNDTPEPTTMSWTASTTPTSFKSDGKHADLKPTAHMYVDSTKTDKAILKKLEDMIYGTKEKEPKMPTPDEVLDLLEGGSAGSRPAGNTGGETTNQ